MLLPFTINPTANPAEGDPPSNPPPPLSGEPPFLLALADTVRPPPLSERERVGAAFAAAPLAIVALDRDGRVTLWNAAAEAAFGWSACEACGRRPSAEFGQLAARALAGETLIDVEGAHARKDGGTVSLRASLAPMRSASGDIDGVVSIFSPLPSAAP